jgi:probable phosphoglycerate mutase
MIYLLRHGQTEFNRDGRIQGQRDSTLTALGRRQAQAMAALLAHLTAGEPGWRLVSSPLGRTMATAEFVGRALKLPIEPDPRLMEVGCGAWEGLLRSDLIVRHPEAFATREWFFAGPGAETYDQVMSRVAGWLGDQPPEPRRLIVVSHGVAGRLLRGAYAGLSRGETNNQAVPQDAVFRLNDGRIERIAVEPVEA